MAGGILVINRAKVLRCDLASSDDRISAQAPRVALFGQLEGCVHILGHILNSRFAVRSAVYALYGQRMQRYLGGLNDNLAVPLCLFLVDVPALSRHPGQENIPSSLQARYWYLHSMILRHFLLQYNYAVLRANRSADVAE